MKLNIAHLYPELLNLYGDKGNITSFKKRAEWRNIDVQIIEFGINDTIDFDNIDILFIGGGSERDQLTVCDKLREYKVELGKYIEDNGVVLAVCGGYQLLGEYFKTKTETVSGLEILDIYTEYEELKFIDNVIIKAEFLDRPIVGFENHGGRTFINNLTPMGKVVYGNGNNGKDGAEGVVYKNVFGTYLHGPLLPKNPHLCDYIIKKALQNKYGDVELQELDDSVEFDANEYIINQFHN